MFVLTGTASVFRASALATVAAARGIYIPGEPGRVYDTAALTEDNELTIALKSLGATMASPPECTVTTELTPFRCSGTDTVSGPTTCTLVYTRPVGGIGGGTVRAVVTDAAGITTTSAPVSYRVTAKVSVAWTSLPSTLRAGHTYTFTVRVTDATGHLLTGVVPRYLWPTTTRSHRVPFLDGGTLRLVSPGVYRARITLQPRMILAPYWTFAFSTGGVTSTHQYRVTR